MKAKSRLIASGIALTNTGQALEGVVSGTDAWTAKFIKNIYKTRRKS